ncbi:MAG: type II toxin-antitoxin system prevent-host-death family antitoxin [Candidatus Sericytochromatia bacterium]|nr:type II toxin-antitoxin system prevent-host-death family antitoxin [Candidatus Tanganyikabacteria bacterium]
MRKIGLRDLKNKLAEYVRLVKAGETIFVTDRGLVVAELRPHLASPHEDPSERRIRRLAEEGRLRRAEVPVDAEFLARLSQLKGGAPSGTAQQYIDQGREERL